MVLIKFAIIILVHLKIIITNHYISTDLNYIIQVANHSITVVTFNQEGNIIITIKDQNITLLVEEVVITIVNLYIILMEDIMWDIIH